MEFIATSSLYYVVLCNSRSDDDTSLPQRLASRQALGYISLNTKAMAEVEIQYTILQLASRNVAEDWNRQLDMELDARARDRWAVLRSFKPSDRETAIQDVAQQKKSGPDFNCRR